MTITFPTGITIRVDNWGCLGRGQDEVPERKVVVWSSDNCGAVKLSLEEADLVSRAVAFATEMAKTETANRIRSLEDK